MGILIDIAGAGILAIPDFRRTYTRYFYGGQVEAALQYLRDISSTARITEHSDWYEGFVEALKEYLLPRDIPEEPWFDVDKMNRSENIKILDNNMNPTTVPITLHNILRDLRIESKNEKSNFRRLGIYTLAVGFVFQAGGIYFRTPLLNTVLCS